MSLTAAKALKAAIQNKDIEQLLAESGEIFGVYQPAFEFITEYYGQHQVLPSETLLQDKFGEDVLDGAGPVDPVTKHYIDQLRSEYLRAGVEEMIVKVGKNLNKRPIEEIIEAITAKTASLSQHATRVEDVDITDIDLAMKEFKKMREERAAGKGGIMTGIDVWDEFSPNGLPLYTVLFGYSSHGKSWIAGKVGANCYKQGYKVLVISLEMTAANVRERMYAMLADGDFNMYDLQRGEIPDARAMRFKEDALNTGGKIIVTSIDGVSDVTPNVIKAKIERHKPDVVIVDYLQLMYDNAKTKDMTPRMMNLSGQMKRLAVSCGIPIICISAVTDDDGKKRNSPPTIAQLAWSRAMEFDADLAIAVHTYIGTNRMELACRKQRNGPLFNLMYDVDLARGVFEPVLEGEGEEG